MRIRCLRQCDVRVPGERVRALFLGQFYDVPELQARQLIAAGNAEEVVTDKSIHGPMDPPKPRAIRG